jgi:hypothetical protein
MSMSKPAMTKEEAKARLEAKLDLLNSLARARFNRSLGEEVKKRWW